MFVPVMEHFAYSVLTNEVLACRFAVQRGFRKLHACLSADIAAG